MLQLNVGMASRHEEEAYPMTLHVVRSQHTPAGQSGIIYAKFPAVDPETDIIVDEEYS
jgi:hypothetical protein